MAVPQVAEDGVDLNELNIPNLVIHRSRHGPDVDMDLYEANLRRVNPEIEIINWSGDERTKFRQIAQQEWENWAGKTEMTQRYYDAVVSYLKGRNQL